MKYFVDEIKIETSIEAFHDDLFKVVNNAAYLVSAVEKIFKVSVDTLKQRLNSVNEEVTILINNIERYEMRRNLSMKRRIIYPDLRISEAKDVIRNQIVVGSARRVISKYSWCGGSENFLNDIKRIIRELSDLAEGEVYILRNLSKALYY